MRKVYFQFFVAIFSLTIMLNVLPGCSHKKESGYEKAEGEDEHDEYDMPGAAAEFEYRRNIDPATGKVPHERMWQAVLETEALKNVNPNTPSSSTALAPLTWVERGSNSDATGPSSGNPRPGNGVTSGRMKAIWVDIADPTGNTVWVGGVWGGIWKTTNINSATPTWTPINDYLSNLVVTGICQDPTNPNTMYMATGESGLLASYSIVGIIRGDGVFKSTDHGVTWTQLPSTTTLTNCTKILCDATGNVYVSSVGISVVLGLQRSSDGGASWVSINPFTNAATPTSRIVDFEISSTGAMHVVGGLSSAAGIGGYRYTANPATVTTTGWSSPTTMYNIPTGTGARVEITTNGNTIYAAISNADKIDNIGKSTDGGNNWTTTPITAANVTALNGSSGQGAYSNIIGVDPSDPNTIIVGSLNLLKSTDGGANFSKISEWVGTTGQYCHADQHGIVWYDNGNKLLVGTDGGLFYSTNKGVNISDKNTGLRLKQFYGVAAHPTLPNYFLCGAQDNGTHQFNNPGLSNSIEVLGGDGGITGIDQDEPQFQAATYVYANFRRSSNGGATWSSNGSSSTAGLFINPYDYDNAGNRVYAGNVAGQFMRWENPHSGFTFNSVAITDFGTGLISSVTSSALSANRVYFGLTNGRVIKIDNADIATPTSTVITPAAMPAAAYVTCVAEASVNTQNLIATVANYGATNIYSTTDGGTTWAACDGNLPDMPVYWAVYHPDADTKAYIATETGVWSTDLLNGASTIWTPETTFPTVKTSMLKYRAGDRTIAAATYGRGLWTATIPNTTCAPAAISTQPTATNVCAGSTATFSVAATGFAPLTYQWQVSTTGIGGPFTNVGTNSATLTLTGVTAGMNNNVYHVVVTNTCPSTITSANVLLTVQSTLAPTVTTPISYCQNATASALTATGTSLLWYGTNATGGTGSTTAPTPSTATVGSTTYYVSQTGTCGEGPRAAIVVNVTAAPSSPGVTSSLNYCQGTTAIALTATGTNLLWYTTSTGGTGSSSAPVPNTATVGSVTYYVSQTTSGCESPRAAITVNITAAPAAPAVTTLVTYCQNSPAVALTATGTNLLWYGTNATGGTGSTTALTPSTTTLGNTIYYVSQSNGTCESPRAAITVSIVASTPAPTVTTPISYCQGSTATALTATGTNLLWYGTNATGGTGSSTAPIPSTATAGSVTYYVSQTTSCGEGPRAGIVVNIVATPAAPTATTPITYCQGATAAALAATGTNLLWYTVATGGTGSSTAPVPSTTTVGSTTYYVSQSTGACESGRTAIVVTINPTPLAPTVASPVAYCQNATATALTATGTNLLWYGTSATGGTGSTTAPTPSTATAGSITYYVSQTTGTCEGPRAPIVVTVTALPTAPTVTSPVTYCQNATATPLTATGTNLKWYTTATGGVGNTTAPTPITTVIGSISYYVSQSTGTCEGPRAQIVVNVTAQTAAPTVTSPVTYCQGATAAVLNAAGTNLLWYSSATGGTGSSTAPVPSTASAGSTTYYVSQTGTCEGPRAAIVVNVNTTPAAPTATSLIAYCQGATAVALTATGSNLLWYTVATGGTGASAAPIPSTASAGTTTYYVSQTTTGCESNRTAIVVNVTALPAAPTVVSPVVYCQATTATALTATGTGLLWYTTATGGVGISTAPTPNTAVAGTVTYYVAQTNSCGEGARAAIVVNTTATPLAVTNLNVTNITETSAVLNWTGNAGSFYTVEYKISTATTWTIAVTGIAANSVNISNLTRGAAYSWRVYSNCTATGGGNVSTIATFNTSSRNSTITNIKKGFGLKLTPNPIQSSGILDYLVPGNGTVGITVIEANGQIIRNLFNANQNAGQYVLNVTNQLNTLAKGTYIIKITQNGSGMSLKFVKN